MRRWGYLLGVLMVAAIGFYAFYSDILALIVEQRLTQRGIITPKVRVTKSYNKLTLHHVTLNIPLDEQTTLTIKIPQFIAMYSLNSILNNRLDTIKIPNAIVLFPEGVFIPKDPLIAHGHLRYQNGMQGTFYLHDYQQYLEGNIKIDQDNYHLNLMSIPFSDRNLLLTQVMPNLNTDAKITKGIISLIAQGSIDELPKTQALLTLAQINLNSQAYEIKQLNAQLKLTNLEPLTVPGGIMSAKEINYNFPLTNIKANFTINAGNNLTLRIARATANTAGGSVTATNQLYNFNQVENNLILQLTNIELADLIKVIKVDGLSGLCRLSGDLWLQLYPSNVKIKQGHLVKQNSQCQIVYHPKNPITNKTVGEAMKFLQNFIASTVSIEIHTEGANTLAKATLAGKNPDFYNGIPVKLNINLTGSLQAIIDSLFIGTDSVRQLIDLNQQSK